MFWFEVKLAGAKNGCARQGVRNVVGFARRPDDREVVVRQCINL